MSSPAAPDPPATPAARRRPRLRILFALLVTSLSVWFLWSVLSDVGLGNLAGRLLAASGPLVALAVALTVLRYLMLAWRWEIFTRREAPVGLRRITPVLMAGNFLALITPVIRIAGPILRAYYLSKETGRPRARFYGTIIADQASNFAIYALFLALAGTMVSLPGRLVISPAGGAALVAALAGGLFLAYRMLRRVQRGHGSLVGRILRSRLGSCPDAGWRRRLIAWWENLLHSLSGAVIAPGSWWPALGISTLTYAVTVLIQMVSFSAIGAQASAAEVALAVSGAGFAQILLAAPGGAGITEASLVGVFLALGMEQEDAAAGVFLARLLNYAVVAPWGAVSFLSLQRRYGKPQSEVPLRAA